MQAVLEILLSFPFALLSAAVLCSVLRAPLALFHLHSLKCTPQLMVGIQRSKLIYRYRSETPCTRLVRSRRWSWRGRFLGSLAPCSVCHYEPLTFILLEGAQLIEKDRECMLLPTV